MCLCALDGCLGLFLLCQRDRERSLRFLEQDFKGRAVKRRKRFAGANAGIVVSHEFGDLTRQLRADLDGVDGFERSSSSDVLSNVVARDADVAQIVMIIPNCGDWAIRCPQRIRKSNRSASQCCAHQKALRQTQLIIRANDNLAALALAVLHAERSPLLGNAAGGAIRPEDLMVNAPLLTRS